jgi:predicted HNH restriction endonuclease
VPLSASQGSVRTRLEDLGLVFANCHSMIHRGGECRLLSGLRR